MPEPRPVDEMIGRLKARWLAEGTTVRPGASPEALDAFEAKYGGVLPPDFRAYLAAVDGTGDEMDGERFRFWPLAEIISVRESRGGDATGPAWMDRWFPFADFLLNSHAYIIRLSAEPAEATPIAEWDFGVERWMVVPTFGDFLEWYLDDPIRLFHGVRIED